MAQILKQSTAVDVLIGPFIDSTDGYTAETGVSPSVKLSKNGQTLAAKNDITTPVHDADGYYNCELDATDTNTVGTLILTVVGSATSLPVRHEFQVVEEAVYDLYFASGGAGAPTAAAIRTEIDSNSTQLAAIVADTNELQADWTNGGRLDLIIDDILADTAAILIDTAELGTATGASIAADVIAAFSAADSLRIRSSTAQAGGASTITLDASASATDDTYNGLHVHIDSGTGVGQGRVITDYVGSTKVATVSPAWTTTPSSDSVFVLQPASVNVTAVSNTAEDLPTATALATVDSNVDAILVDTAEIGAAGAGLTAIPWNASWDAEVQSEANDAMVALGLDHLVSASVTGTDVTDNSIVARLVSSSATADWDDFVNTTDSMQAIRDRGDSAWTTGAGGTPPQLLQNTTIATLASQTSFTLTAGSADDDAYNGAVVVVTDQSTSTQKAVGSVSDYTGSTKTITLSADPAVFTMAVGDTIDIIANASTAPSAAAVRAEIDSNSTQLAAIVADTNELQTDWANGGRLDLILDARASQTSVDTVDTVVDGIQTDLSNGTDGLGAIKTAVDAIPTSNPTAASIADAVWDEDATPHQTAGTFGEALGDPVATGNSVRDLIATAQTDLDTITGSDGVTLATAQANYAPATAASLATVDTNVDAILVDTGTTLPATLTAIETDTQDIQSRLPAALVSGRMSSDAVAISGSTAAADDLEASALTVITGAAAAGTLSTTQATSDLTGYADDQLIGRILLVTSGAAEGEATDITDYANTSGLLTFTALTTAMSASDTFVIL